LDLAIYNAVDVPKGFVAVVKSKSSTAVAFRQSSSQRGRRPASRRPVSTNETGAAVAAANQNLDEGKLTGILVPGRLYRHLGEGRQPGRYYVNEAAYKITMMSTRVQTWEFKVDTSGAKFASSDGSWLAAATAAPVSFVDTVFLLAGRRPLCDEIARNAPRR